MDHTHRSSWITWALIVIVPLIAAAMAWLLWGAAVSTESCRTGAGRVSRLADAALLILVLAGPVTVTWQGHRAGLALDRLIAATAASVLLSVVLVALAVLSWWSSHNCYT